MISSLHRITLCIVASLLLGLSGLQAQQKPLVVVVHGIGGGQRQSGWAEGIRKDWGVGASDFKEVSFSYGGRTGPGSMVDFSRRGHEWAESVQRQIAQLARENPGREIVLASHSWGTVTSKMALQGADTNDGHIEPLQLPQGSRIKKWVTIGSPLGRDASQRNDPPAGGKLAGSLMQLGIDIPAGKPAAVQGDWINMSDPSDPVSVPSQNLKGAKNVSVPSSGYSWWEYFTNPIFAHTNIWSNQTVIDEVASAYNDESAASRPKEEPAGGGGGGTSGHWPPTDYNSLSVDYAVGGVVVNHIEDTEGWAQRRDIQGWFRGSEFVISGTAHSDRDHPHDTEYGSFPSQLEVTIEVDGKTDVYTAETEPNQGPWSHPFRLSIPIDGSSREGSFTIRVTYVNPRNGNRSVNVEGYFTKEPGQGDVR